MKIFKYILLFSSVVFSQQHSVVYRSELTFQSDPAGNKGVMILSGDDLKFSRGNVVSISDTAKIYNSINPHTMSLNFGVRPNFRGNDGLQHHIFEVANDDTNRIRLFKGTDDSLYFIAEFSNDSSALEYDISGWDRGDWHHIGCLIDKNKSDGSNSLVLFIDGIQVDSTTSDLGLPMAVESSWDLGSDDASSAFDGVLTLQISNVPFKDTESQATIAGLPSNCSFEYYYNSGSFNKFAVTEDTRFVLVED